MNTYLSLCLYTQFTLFSSCMKTCQMSSSGSTYKCLPSLNLYCLTVEFNAPFHNMKRYAVAAMCVHEAPLMFYGDAMAQPCG